MRALATIQKYDQHWCKLSVLFRSIFVLFWWLWITLVMISFCYTQHFRLFDLMLYTCLQPSYLEKYPSFYRSPKCERLKSFVRSRQFEYIVVFVLLMNLIAVIIETTVWQWQYYFLFVHILHLTQSHNQQPCFVNIFRAI